MTALEIGGTVAALALVPLAVMFWLAHKAPLGWEDADGFHTGDEHADKDNLGI